jgi:hypothetical protein
MGQQKDYARHMLLKNSATVTILFLVVAPIITIIS